MQIAVTDLYGFGPFSIAVLLGHPDLATVVLEIAAAQYQPENRTDRYRYTIEPYDENESYSNPDNDGDNDSDNSNEKVNVVSKLVDEDYTIHDINALADTIKSKVSPMQLLIWYSEAWRALDDSKNDIAARNTSMPGLQNRTPTLSLGIPRRHLGPISTSSTRMNQTVAGGL